MTEIRRNIDGTYGVYALRSFNAGELIATYGVSSHQVEVPENTDMFIALDNSYIIGNSSLDTKEHAQFIRDAAGCSASVRDGDTIHDLSLKDILLIAEYLSKSITKQNVCNEGLFFYSCKHIEKGEELYISYGTTYHLKNDLIDACIQALSECQCDEELSAAQGIDNVNIRTVKVYKIEKRIILDFVDMLISGEYREFYKVE